MKAIVYLRISQDRTGERAGVTRQREDCLRRAAERGWQVVDVQTDNDISAAGKRKRPGFDALLKAVAAGTVQVVVAWDLTRLQRSRRDEVRLYELCQAKGVILSLVNGADLDFSTAAGRFVADSLGSVARLEIEMKSDRQRRAQVQAAEQGRRTGGRRPFGYDADGITVRPAEAAAIATAYESVLYGVPLREVARQWNAQGFVTGQARYAAGHEGEPSPWRADSVRAVLLNPRNIGKRAHNGEIVADAVWPAIVAPERFEAVVAILRNPARRSGKPGGRQLLSGLAVCGVCGATVHAGGTTRPGVRNYRCSGSSGHLSRRAEPVEEYVEAMAVAVLSRADASHLVHDKSHPDLAALAAEAVGVRERLDALAVDFADGSLTASQLRAATNRLRERLTEIDASLADAGKVDVLGPLVAAKDVRMAWDGLSVSRKRAALEVLMKIVIHPPGRGVRRFDPSTVDLIPTA
ncbi:recombinase family protein [Pseudarthrobacter sp. alpha12b]